MKRILRVILLSSILLLAGCIKELEISTDQRHSSVEQSTEQSTNEQEQPTDTEPVEDPLEHEPDLFVHMIDVGQGDSIFIELPNDETVLIDGGETHAGGIIIQYLQNRGITKIDYLIGTHPDSDHIGGLPDVIETFDIGEVYLPDKEHTTTIFEKLLNAISDKGLQFNVGETGVKIVETIVDDRPLILEIISPSPERVAGYSNNDASIIIMMTYGTNRFLFTGDAGEEVEEDLLADGVDLRADVLKVGHHGSRYSSIEDFLKAVRPTIALISAGKDNSYSHPHQEVLARLSAIEAEVYRTDLLGTIVLSSNGEEIAIGDDVYLPEEEEIFDHVVINEVYPNPNSGEKEWVELYNPTDEAIDISGYTIREEGSYIHTVLEGTIIPAKGFFVLEFDRHVFNNTGGDSVILLDLNEVELDRFTYTRTEKGKSYYRMTDGGYWALRPGEPTPGKSNQK